MLYQPIADRIHETAAPIGPLADGSGDLADIELLHLHWPEWFGFDAIETHERLIARLAARDVPVVWTAHNLTPHERRPEVYDAIYQRWADTADAVIHHTAWGRDRMLARYRFRPDCEHAVIPHGHFGEMWSEATTMSRADAETALGLPAAPIRIGLIGAPREDKLVVEFLEAFAACSRDDVQVVCWSLAFAETAPSDARIAAAEQYRGVDPAVYARRLAACDALALPFDPDGDMLATGTIADAIGVGIPPLVSDWSFLTEMVGDAGIRMGHTVTSMQAALETITTEDLARSRTAVTALRPRYEWSRIAESTFALLERTVLRGSGGQPAA